MTQYLSFLANSVDPDQSKLADQDLHCLQNSLHCCFCIVDTRVTCFHLLKIASDGNFYLLFGENY